MISDGKPLSQDHLPDHAPVFPGPLAAGFRTLEQSVISLGIEQPFLVESGFLKAMVHVGSQDEIVLVLQQLKQIAVGGFRRIHIAVDPDIPAPVRPEFFLRIIRIEPAGIHIPETVLPAEITEVPVKALAGVYKPGSG